ncbi:D-alanine--D-alanine ligase [Vulcanimicrobium alpinum]|uniref:D-alanine--D-alanine ligase n=1 Tax=Vulcanimicrobium alpinum TaxID=3016050 RepID=A0AAN1XZW3_UNVUL|nr:D-alanine--D-alanine ligase [Vulcanimicrobium alpinum]BDE07926.1 D-alanine--D-alanine ligase [Vulcanimicrobium alpinum]
MKVAVVMGGPSAEREVSIQSGTGVMRALAALGHDARSLDFDGRFVEAIREIAPDVVFNALHGPGGEDGTIQGILEWMGIPFTGSGIAACAVAMDKHLTKKLLAAEGLPTPAWDVFDLTGGTLPLLPGSLNLPLVVKPRASGSSAGVVIVKSHEAWSKAVLAASTRTPEVLAEEFVPGREFSCGVLGEEALPVVEIVPSDEFYSYDAKYKPGGSRHLIPAPIDHDLTSRLQTLALSVHRLLGLRDYSRTDFIVTKEGRPTILEINALPGMTPTSLLPEEALSAGISYEALVERLVQHALARATELQVG